MNEAVWLSATAPRQLLDRLVGTTPRKQRLFAVACCRHVLPLTDTAYTYDALTTAELYADGLEKRSRMVMLGGQIRNSPRHDPWVFDTVVSHAVQAVGAVCQPGIALDLGSVLGWIAAALCCDSDEDSAEGQYQLKLLRDIFGNPFRAVAFDPAWRTEAAVGIALRMYDDRDFAAMPILADALQEAGCEDADILAHCREPGVHVRGCWVVDLVLGKA